MDNSCDSPGGLAQLITDPVTGSHPRALLQPRLDEEIARARGTAGRCAVVLFDIDFFKTVNDSYGHLRGDEVLRQLTERVQSLVRRSDTLFRFGGDEFVLLLPDTGRAEALHVALRLADGVREREFPGDPTLQMSVSLGVAAYPEDGADTASLLACADRRNYLAKRRGRGGAVGDDVDTGISRLRERDAALGVAQEFLTRLQSGRRGALRVTGERGVGHTRFLAEIATVAELRGFTVVTLPADGTAPADGTLPPDGTEPPDGTLPTVIAGGGAGTSTSGVVVLADLDVAEGAAAALAAADRRDVAGVVYASTDAGAAAPFGTKLPLLGTAELAPWSPSALRIWLRGALNGEPSRALTGWFADQCGGLPARAAQELSRLRERGGLVPTDGGGWTLKPMMVSRPRRRTRLPVPMTRLVGRQQERAEVVGMLADTRLVTLVGPGGIGKTRLSLSVAAAVSEDFDDGVVFVPLAEATGLDLAVAAIARALQVGEVPGQPLLESLLHHLAEARMLLVLDNFEQVMGAAGVVGELLSASAGLSVLVTSRERLSLDEEQVYQVPPLALPDLDRLPAQAEGVARIVADSPALALFDERARAANVNFTLSPETLSAVAALCRRLDGLPLAIELAAARTDRWDPHALLADLSHHLDALGEGPRDLPLRQQTLRGAIDWSFALLGAEDQRLFTRLAVFAGGCTMDAAFAVAGKGDRDRDRDDTDAGDAEHHRALGVRMAALTNKSLLITESDPDGATRYRMLETIHAYAVARLAADPAFSAVYARHAAHYATVADRAGGGLTGPEQADWVGRLDREYPNLRAALSWAVIHDDLDTAARLCLGVWRFWHGGNHIGEGREWLNRVLAAPAGLSDRVRAQASHAGAVLAATQDEHEPAYRLAADSLRYSEAAGDRELSARARNALGIAAVARGDYNLATDHFRQCLGIWRELGRPEGAAIALGNLTKAALRLDDIATAAQYAEECLRLERAAGNTRGIVLGLECQAQILLARGEVRAARAVLDESLALSRTLGDALGEAMALHQLGLAAQLDGDQVGALRLLTDALTRRHDEEDREDLATSLDSVANVVAATDAPLATRLLAAAEGLRRRHRLPDPPESETRRDATLAAVRAALASHAFTAAWEAGHADPLDLIVDQAFAATGG